MATGIRDALETLVFSGRGVPRHTQDSSVLPDTWFGFVLEAGAPLRMLLVPHYEGAPERIAQVLRDRLDEDLARHPTHPDAPSLADRGARSVPEATIAAQKHAVAIRAGLGQLVRVVLPLTTWWQRALRDRTRGVHPLVGPHLDRGDLAPRLIGALEALRDPGRPLATRRALGVSPDLAWFALVVGTLAHPHAVPPGDPATVPADPAGPSWGSRLRALPARDVVDRFLDVVRAEPGLGALGLPTRVHTVNRNRAASTTLVQSTATVKCDAARRLFDVTGRRITWAVIDSGVDATHGAFRRRTRAGDPEELPFAREEAIVRGERLTVARNHTRVVRTLDFTCLEELLSDLARSTRQLNRRARDAGLSDADRKALKACLDAGRWVDWALLEPLLEIPMAPATDDGGYRPPVHHHGTHVAGILGADWAAGPDDEPRVGMCPDIELVDLRVFDDHGRGSEFAILAALDWVRWRNATDGRLTIQGVNLSLALPHEVSNYACGRTPVCDACRSLVGVGVTVVAAAGNQGRALYVTAADETEEGYRSISITDPGNTAEVITVGATHRKDAHKYGVSYFSSRGPTGDGRIKPDLVAPGEKITAPVPGEDEADLDGTSMAAPHVSGAAALLMDRHRELIGEPMRIKQILMDAATDLGREPYFQGAGLLDVLRALQSH